MLWCEARLLACFWCCGYSLCSQCRHSHGRVWVCFWRFYYLRVQLLVKTSRDV